MPSYSVHTVLPDRKEQLGPGTVGSGPQIPGWNVRGHVRELQTQIQFLKISVLIDFVDFNEKNSVIHQSRRFKEIIHRIIRLNHPDYSSQMSHLICFRE